MSKSSKAQPPKDFESALGELEGLVEKMESGTLSLEDSLTAYKRGMELTAFCQKTLADAEQQVKILEHGVLKDFPAATDDPADDE
jgi:exodeoxyribonuclease VII small subunit